MARQRRGGFPRPELRGTLGTLLRTTLAQAGVVRDALERGAREGRSRLDDALAGRRRDQALAELGERVLELIRQGEIDLAELPELHDVVAHLDELDADRGEVADEDAAVGADFAALPSRSRFDRRGGDGGDGTVSSGAWRPPRAPHAPRGAGPAASSADPAAGPASRPAPRVWRPVAAVDAAADRPEDDATSPGRPPARRAFPKQGGISFDDEDLADYMHPDDVPPKGSPDHDS